MHGGQGILTNNGEVNIDSDGTFDQAATGSYEIVNHGDFTKTGGSGTTTIDVPFTNYRNISANIGTLHFANSFELISGGVGLGGGRVTFLETLALPSGSTLSGSGTITGNIEVRGNLAPGNSVGSITIEGDLTLTASTLSFFEVDMTAEPITADFVQVDGTLNLDGMFSWELLESIDPISTDMFTLYTANNLTGSFLNAASGTRLYNSDLQRSFVINYGSASMFDPNSVILSNFEFVPVPEPSTWVLMITGLFVVVVFQLRRRRTS
ncbi:MAG: PEP-CTERM sorting domain-containing protein [Candidatus Synoicihabitans palmerolidicus]|nr:PEP-CTERM sorting domain-containing protein [Candidatus Synoicihabitans palmerolidicus]